MFIFMHTRSSILDHNFKVFMYLLERQAPLQIQPLIIKNKAMSKFLYNTRVLFNSLLLLLLPLLKLEMLYKAGHPAHI